MDADVGTVVDGTVDGDDVDDGTAVDVRVRVHAVDGGTADAQHAVDTADDTSKSFRDGLCAQCGRSCVCCENDGDVFDGCSGGFRSGSLSLSSHRLGVVPFGLALVYAGDLWLL